jgi:hypothetical protein
VVVIAMLAGAGFAVAGARAARGPGVGSSPPAPPPSASTTPSPTPTATTPQTTGPVAGAPCTATELTFVNAQTDHAMGSAYRTYVLRNGGQVGCRLQHGPTLQYIASGGASADIPADYTSDGASVLVRPGGAVAFNTQMANGYGGYPPDSPACAHPATYRRVSVVLSDGSAVALGPDEVIFIQCGGISVSAWGLSTQ